jgi:glutathione-regulated potassium-efflux system ancillary protein KefC
MLVSPLILVAIDKLLLPRHAHCGVPVLDEISEQQEAPIIIAGFGRYGQIVARMLLAHGIPCTVLDHDAEMIEAARSFGYRVFYGDASRLDLLRIAGAERARVIVLAVDGVEQSLAMAELIAAQFPQAQIVARARDVAHWNRLRALGVTLVERELFEASLRMGCTVLELLGHSADEAHELARRFRVHNIALVDKMYPHFKDRDKLLAVVRQGREQLEAQLAQERQEQVTQARNKDAG